MRLSVGLVHYPILDRAKKEVATNVTNFDIHDIARACRVYNVENYYIIHPAQEQLMFVSRVLDHWKTGVGSRLNPMRRTALGPVATAESIPDALRQWGQEEAQVWATHARDVSQVPALTFSGARQQLEEETPVLLIFGTGFGLAPAAYEHVDACIEPIRGEGPEDYRHLSVRSAVSICLDRLCSAWYTTSLK